MIGTSVMKEIKVAGSQMALMGIFFFEQMIFAFDQNFFLKKIEIMIYEKNKTKIIKQNVELNKKLEKSVKAKR